MADSVLQTRGAASASLAALPVIIGSDTYPVAVAVRYLKRSENIGYAAVYIIFAVLLFLRLSFPRKPMSFHRQTAYQLFVLMCITRVPQFVLMAIGAHDSSDYNSPGWKLVLTTDLLSTFGWAFFMGAVFGLGYSWSGRIPCVYCMVQFSDEPHWMKGVAVYLLPSALTVMSIVATILRIVGAIHPWSDGVRAANPVIFTRTTWLARASVATALALAGCFIIVVPYTAMQRRHRRMLSRGSGINHSQVAAMVQSGSFHKMTGYEPGAVLGLMFIGVCLMIEAVYRVMLVDTTRVLGLSTSWFRGQVAVDILCVLPEWIALLTVTLLDFEAMHNGTVELRWYWQDVVIYTHPSVEELPIEASEASFWTSRPLIPEGPKTLSTSTVASPPRYGDSPISPTTLRLSQASFMSPNMNMSPPPPQRGPPHRTHLQVPVTTLSTPILPSEVTPTGSTPILLKQFPSPPLSHASQHTASTSQTEHTASTFGHAGGERARDRYSEQASFDQYIKEEAA